MKKIIFLFIAGIFLFACENEPAAEIKDEVVDLDAVKTEINNLSDSFYKAMTDKKGELMDSLFAENGLFLGTDPDEFWVKDTTLNMFKSMSEDTTLDLTFTINKREIRVAPSGKSALVIEQYMYPFISESIQIRFIGRYVMTDTGWKIDFIDWAMIPENEDLPKINNALKAEE